MTTILRSCGSSCNATCSNRTPMTDASTLTTRQAWRDTADRLHGDITAALLDACLCYQQQQQPRAMSRTPCAGFSISGTSTINTARLSYNLVQEAGPIRYCHLSVICRINGSCKLRIAASNADPRSGALPATRPSRRSSAAMRFSQSTSGANWPAMLFTSSWRSRSEASNNV